MGIVRTETTRVDEYDCADCPMLAREEQANSECGYCQFLEDELAIAQHQIYDLEDQLEYLLAEINDLQAQVDATISDAAPYEEAQ